MDKIKDINKWFAAELTDRLEEVGIRSYHLQTLCHMSGGEIDRCLEGTGFPKLFSLVLMAEYLECSVNDLLGYDEIDDPDDYERYSASGMYFAESQYACCLSERMRRYMQYHSIEFNEIADKTGFKVDIIRHWFAKSHPQLPPTKKFIVICEAIGCTPSELLGY